MADCHVIVKEFYPIGIGVSRQDDMSLSITDESLFEEMKDHFAEGQSNHANFYEYYQDQALPRMFFYGDANNTVYAVSDPGKGRVLSHINFATLELDRIASIMEFICSAIRKIHIKENCIWIASLTISFFTGINLIYKLKYICLTLTQ